jgi:hypothetical protein
MRPRTGQALLGFLLVLLSPLVAADAFTDRFVVALKREFPNAVVQVAGADALQVSIDGKEPHRSLFLDNIRRQCAAEPATCDASIDRHIRILASVRDGGGDANAARLRLIHRHREYVAHAERFMREAAEKEQRAGKASTRPIEDSLLVSRPWLGDVVQIIVVDYPDRTNPLSRGLLRDLGLAAEDAFRLAVDQTEQEMASIDPMALPGADRVFLVGGSYYASSYFGTRAWHAFAERRGANTAFGCVASSELVAVALQPDAATEQTFQRLCRAINAREPRPVSPEILEWRADSGWRARAAR